MRDRPRTPCSRRADVQHSAGPWKNRCRSRSDGRLACRDMQCARYPDHTKSTITPICRNGGAMRSPRHQLEWGSRRCAVMAECAIAPGQRVVPVMELVPHRSASFIAGPTRCAGRRTATGPFHPSSNIRCKSGSSLPKRWQCRPQPFPPITVSPVRARVPLAQAGMPRWSMGLHNGVGMVTGMQICRAMVAG